MVMANGKAYFSFENDATPNDCSSDFNSGQLGTSDSSYRANNCNLRLLLRRPCAVGTYHGATKTVATEADAACSASPYPAGTYSATAGATSSAACSSILNAGSPCAAGKYGAAGKTLYISGFTCPIRVVVFAGDFLDSLIVRTPPGGCFLVGVWGKKSGCM